ncbi:MAG: hypothetical protein QNJ77_04810 [Acidimicrobiia bacterium]|nr:hypothetical protein [Acidimicrobiia bacterium]
MSPGSVPTTEFTLRDDGIVLGRAINPDVPRTRENVAQALDELDQLTGGEPRPGLWDPRAVTRFPPHAWSVLVSRLSETFVALAILVNDETEKAMGAFPDAIDAFLIPVRLFRSEAPAISWLQQFIDDDPPWFGYQHQ